MTTDPALRIPPAIRARLHGIEAELRPTPQRVPLAGGRPALYVVDARIAARVRPRSVRRSRPILSRRFGALAGVVSLVTLATIMGLTATGGGMPSSAGPSGSGSARPGAAGSATPSGGLTGGPNGSAAPSAPGNSLPGRVLPPGTPPLGYPSLVDIQVIRVAEQARRAATNLLRSDCVAKESGLDPLVVKKLITTARVGKIDHGWLDADHQMLIARDSIDAAQAFGGTILVESADETWVIARDDTGLLAIKLDDVPTIADRRAWWSVLVLRPVAC